MNNIDLIASVLHYIDDHLGDDISFSTLASIYGYSPFHFHRIFSAITGATIANYIKDRRLKFAHRQLTETTESILELCYQYGFNSIQTFNRSFKETFGYTPSDARQKQIEIVYPSVESIVNKYRKSIKIDGDYTLTPRMIERDAFLLAGSRKHTRDGGHVIGETWANLKANWDKLDRANSYMYGFEDYSEDFIYEPVQHYYMAAAEVKSPDSIPKGFSVKEIPKSLYAVFTVKGNNANGEIGRAFRYIYDIWLPNSEYCISNVLTADFEFYDERWDCQSPDSQVDLYIPIQKMTKEIPL